MSTVKLWLVLIALLGCRHVWATPVRVVARVEGARRAALPDAAVTITAGPHVLAGDEPILDGRLDLRVELQGAAVLCEFHATGYQPERRNVPVLGGIANAGLVVMQPLAGLVLGELIIYQPPNRKEQLVDLQVRNSDLDQKVEIVRVKLAGTRRRSTKCVASAVPAINFQFPSIAVKSRESTEFIPMNVAISGQPVLQRLSANGCFELLPCEQVRLQLAFEFPFTLAPGEQQKLRLSLPNVLPDHVVPSAPIAETTRVRETSSIAHKHTAPLLALHTWHYLSLTVTLSDHRTFTTQLHSSSPQE